jgi:hypothetical protein
MIENLRDAVKEFDRVQNIGRHMYCYLESLSRMPDLPYKLAGLRPISEMLPIWHKELLGQEKPPES